MRTEDKEILSIRVSPEFKKKIEEAAEKDRRSVTQFLIILIEKALNIEEQR